MIKRILSVCLSVALLLTTLCFAVGAEETVDLISAEAEAKVLFTVGEADENGVFTAKLSLHRLTFLGMEFGILYNKDVIAPVNADGELTDSFSDMAVANEFVSGEKTLRFTYLSSKLDAEQGLIEIAAIMTQSEGADLVVDEAGFVAYEFRFKEIREGDYGFALADYPYANYDKAAILSNGDGEFPFSFRFVYPEGGTDQNTDYDFDVDRGKYDPDPTPAEPTKEELRAARLKNTVMLQIGNYAVSVNGGLKWVDKENQNVVPYIESDRTMVPIRFISEAMGANVTWDAPTRTVSITLDDVTITMQVGNTQYTAGGETAVMDAAPEIREDRTFVPIRFVSEALNKAVHWEAGARMVIITPIDFPWNREDPVSQQIVMDTLAMFHYLRDNAYDHEKN